MNRTNKEIRENFSFFNELLGANKIVLSQKIELQPKTSNQRWLLGLSDIKHITIDKDIKLLVERNLRDAKYGIKLRCPFLSKEPFFRFDSDGPAHRNNHPDIPLEEQTVQTPHFNSFREDGKLIAYQNETLKNEKEAKIISDDINFGISLFCMEAKINSSTGYFPTVIDKEPEFEFDNIHDIDFDNINFE